MTINGAYTQYVFLIVLNEFMVPIYRDIDTSQFIYIPYLDKAKNTVWRKILYTIVKSKFIIYFQKYILTPAVG